MDGRETQLLSSGTKRGGWITFPFIIGQPLSLSVCLTHTEFVWINIFLIYIKQGQRQASHLEVGDGYRTDRIFDSGVRFEKHKCCLDFKHSEW